MQGRMNIWVTIAFLCHGFYWSTENRGRFNIVALEELPFAQSYSPEPRVQLHRAQLSLDSSAWRRAPETRWIGSLFFFFPVPELDHPCSILLLHHTLFLYFGFTSQNADSSLKYTGKSPGECLKYKPLPQSLVHFQEKKKKKKKRQTKKNPPQSEL